MSISKNIHIQGVELDQQENKRFLCMKYNKEKKNYRSPYTNTFWPENLRTYVTPKINQLEGILNTFLEHYAQIYYSGGISSGFAVELSSNKLVFYIGILKQNDENNTQISSSYSYKVFSSIHLTHSDINKDSSFRVEVNSELYYNLSFEIVPLKEKVATHGLLKNNFKKNYHGESRNISPEEIIEIIGSCFEKSESSLRNKELVNTMKTFQNQVKQIDKQENVFKTDLEGFFKDLKQLKKYTQTS